MRKASATVASTVLHVQKVQSSTSAALARKPIETPSKWTRVETPSKWARPPPQATGKWAPTPDRSASGWKSPRPRSGPQQDLGKTFGQRSTPQVVKSLERAPQRLPETVLPIEKPGEPSTRPKAVSLEDVSIDPEELLEEEASRRPRRQREERSHGRSAWDRVRADSSEKSKDKDRSKQKPAEQPMAAVTRKPKMKAIKEVKVSKDVFIPSMVSVGTLAKLLRVKQDRIADIMYDLELGNSEYDRVLKADDASLIAMELEYNPVVDDVAAFDIYPEPMPSDQSSLPARPPIVTIMGHVDHGKTTLLDTLRSATVAAGESGGITQHIGAFSVPLNSLSVQTSGTNSKTVTFLDTPGHAAFSAMRARGANVTDIIVLVVAADDGVMPQTREVINLATKDSKVQMIVAINKCDKPGIDATNIKHDLLSEGVELEEFGGDIPCVEVSGLTGLGLDKLMETIIAVAEISDLRAEKNLRAHGHVLEARMEKGKGAVATVLVSRGTLNRGDPIVAGATWAKVRQMTDDKGRAVTSATPGMPVTVSGWDSLPVAGDEVLAPSPSKKAADEVKRAVTNRIREKEAETLMDDVQSINEKRRLDRRRRNDQLLATSSKGGNAAPAPAPASASAYAQDEDDGIKELRLIVKADVSGTIEAVVGAIEGIGNKEARVSIIQSGVGDVTDSDVALAKTTDGMILGFNVSVPRNVEGMASQACVPLHVDTVIYRLIEEVTARVTALLPKIIEKKVVGEATVQQLFGIKQGKATVNVAGCRVVNGILAKHKTARVVRNGEVVADCKLNEMRHLKSEVNEVRKGMECGLRFETYADFQPGDLIQAYDIIEIEPTL